MRKRDTEEVGEVLDLWPSALSLFWTFGFKFIWDLWLQVLIFSVFSWIFFFFLVECFLYKIEIFQSAYMCEIFTWKSEFQSLPLIPPINTYIYEMIIAKKWINKKNEHHYLLTPTPPSVSFIIYVF